MVVIRVHGGIINDQMLSGSLRYFDIEDAGGLGTNVIGPSANQRAAYASIGAGGSGYSVSDVLTLAGGTAGTAATFTVGTIGASGEVTSVSLTTTGNMTTVVANPVATTGGGGAGATLVVEYTSLVIVPGATGATGDGGELFVGVGKPVPNSAAEQALRVVQGGVSGLYAGVATIVQIAIVDTDIIRIAVENEGFSWDTPGAGDAAAEMQAAIRALSTVTVPDTTDDGVTFDFAGATVTERTLADFT